MDIERVLLALAFVGLIFILLDSYCGCNTLEGIEETKAYCNPKDKGSKCPGIDGVLCTELTDCQDKDKCPCPTKEEILENICPPPRSIFFIIDGLDIGNAYFFKKFIADKYIDAAYNLEPLWLAPQALLPLKYHPNEIFELEKFFIILDPPIKILITPKKDTTKTYTFTYKLLSGVPVTGIFGLIRDTELSPDEITGITNEKFLELYRTRNDKEYGISQLRYNKSSDGRTQFSNFDFSNENFDISIGRFDTGPGYPAKVSDKSRVEINSLEVKY